MRASLVAFSIASASAALLSVIATACGSSGDDVVVPANGDASNASDTNAPPPACPATQVIAKLSDLVSTIATNMSIVAGPDSGAMVVPSSAERDMFASEVLGALAFDSTLKCPLPPSYRVFSLEENGDDVRLVAELDGTTGAPAPKLFWGAYAARRPHSGTRALIIEAPHPVADSNTDVESAEVFSAVRAEFYLLAGTHRCSNVTASGCDGTTDACTTGPQGPFREADAAHSTKAPFWAVHAALSTATSSPFLQLHGNTQPCPQALVSDGSGTYSDAGLAAELGNALVAKGISVGRCGQGYPTMNCTLCATDNVEARATARSQDACTQSGVIYGRFVHVEQQATVRMSPGDQVVIDAVNEVFAPR